MTHIPGGFAVDINHKVTQLDNAADDYRSTVYYLSGLDLQPSTSTNIRRESINQCMQCNLQRSEEWKETIGEHEVPPHSTVLDVSSSCWQYFAECSAVGRL